MTTKVTTIKELRKLAIAINTSIKVYYPILEKEELLYVNVTLDFERGYNIHNGVMAFVYDGILYVLPCTETFVSILKENVFYWHKGLYVPFSDGAYPIDKRNQWDKLLESTYE